MKPAILKRISLGCSALLFSILFCYGQGSPSDQLVGTWVKTMNGRTATFTISSDQTYQVEFTGNEEIDVYGSYVVEGTRVTFNDEGGQYAAKDVPGVYDFQVNDNSLTFTEADDPLAGRKVLLEGKWSEADMP